MRYTSLGTTDLALPAVSFGAWAIGGWFWGGTDDALAIEAIHAGIDAGITCIDTAPTYGMGHSETVVGKAIQGKRDQVILATKCGMRWDRAEGQRMIDTEMNDGTPCTIYRNGRPDSIEEECENSLRRLGTDVIDLYQVHWPDSTWPLDDTMATLLKLKEAGKIRAIGVSNFDTEMIALCQTQGTVDSIQPRYNALQRDPEEALLPYCVAHHIGVLAYSPIAQGLLTGKVGMERRFPEGDIRNKNPLFQPENRRAVLAMLERVQPVAEKHGVTLGQLFTAWVTHQPGVTTALVGARNAAQAQENAVAGTVTLDEADLRAIRREVEGLALSE
jgi:aryl-alcohol dehydrogenase-like predicted oxidoreductase